MSNVLTNIQHGFIGATQSYMPAFLVTLISYPPDINLSGTWYLAGVHFRPWLFGGTHAHHTHILVLHLYWSLKHTKHDPTLRTYTQIPLHDTGIQRCSPSPGAQLSTRAPRARPVCQSRLKLVMGSSGSLFWIHPNSLCLGVFCLPSSPSSSSSHMGMEME